MTPTPNAIELAATATTGLIETYRRPLLIAMIVICGLGLVWTVWSGFKKKN
jgi:hypothetical protein